MATKRKPLQPPPADGRERILSAAIQLFAEAGYEGSSTAGVARVAGVAQPLVHHHFGSKEGLWKAALDRVLAEGRPFEKLPPGLPPDEALAAAIEGYVRLCADRPEIARLVARESMSRSWRLEYLVKQHFKAQYHEAVETFRRAQALGLVQTDIRPELALFFILGGGAHFFDVAPLAKLALGLDAEGADREPYIQMVVQFVMRGLGARVGTKR